MRKRIIPDGSERDLTELDEYMIKAADITPESWPVSKMPGNYTAMVHRNPDGSDPLVQEPGP